MKYLNLILILFLLSCAPRQMNIWMDNQRGNTVWTNSSGVELELPGKWDRYYDYTEQCAKFQKEDTKQILTSYIAPISAYISKGDDKRNFISLVHSKIFNNQNNNTFEIIKEDKIKGYLIYLAKANDWENAVLITRQGQNIISVIVTPNNPLSHKDTYDFLNEIFILNENRFGNN